MHDAPLFLLVIIKIDLFSLSCDILQISLIYVFAASQ